MPMPQLLLDVSKHVMTTLNNMEPNPHAMRMMNECVGCIRKSNVTILS